MGQTSEDPEPAGSIDWIGLPSAAVVRAALGLLLAAAISVLGAFVLGEYEFEGSMPLAAGLLFGIVVGEVAVEVGRRRTVAVALACAGLAAGGLLWAGWIAAGEGLEPIPGGAWLAAGVGAAAAALRVVGLRRRSTS